MSRRVVLEHREQDPKDGNLNQRAFGEVRVVISGLRLYDNGLELGIEFVHFGSREWDSGEPLPSNLTGCYGQALAQHQSRYGSA